MSTPREIIQDEYTRKGIAREKSVNFVEQMAKLLAKGNVKISIQKALPSDILVLFLSDDKVDQLKRESFVSGLCNSLHEKWDITLYDQDPTQISLKFHKKGSKRSTAFPPAPKLGDVVNKDTLAQWGQEMKDWGLGIWEQFKNADDPEVRKRLEEMGYSYDDASSFREERAKARNQRAEATYERHRKAAEARYERQREAAEVRYEMNRMRSELAKEARTLRRQAHEDLMDEIRKDNADLQPKTPKPPKAPRKPGRIAKKAKAFSKILNRIKKKLTPQEKIDSSKAS